MDKTWLASVALKEVSYFVAKAASGLFLSPIAIQHLNQLGVSLDPTSKTVTIVGPVLIGAILHGLHDWAKVKFDWKVL